MRKLLALLLIGCGSSPSHPSDPVEASKIVMDVTVVAPAPAPAPTPGPAPAAPRRVGPLAPIIESVEAVLAGTAYPDAIRSVQLLASTAVRQAPRADADKLGVIGKGARAAVRTAAPGGDGCTRGRWLEIEPRGWVCEAAVRPSEEAPTAAPAASLAEDDGGAELSPVEGKFGTVRDGTEAFATTADALAGENGREREGAHTVRVTETVTAQGRKLARTSDGELIDASRISTLGPSTFKGVVLADQAPLPAWVRARKDPKKPAVTREAPAATAAAIGSVAPRTVVTILEEAPGGEFVRISDKEWIARADLRVASVAAPPPGTGDTERWFDVDLEQQVIVAYEGKRPVYATLVSTGRLGHTTPTLVARVGSKLLTSDMISTKNEKYSVADVPWTMFYDGGYALHTSYWHDGFGDVRSHGCINLAPRDARLLYKWSSPDVPPGWIAVYGNEENPGSLVRVRSKTDAEPELRGYARAVRDRAAGRGETIAAR
jgi:lipoprotein-anchoring transpeptidase ErfK/SrfK